MIGSRNYSLYESESGSALIGAKIYAHPHCGYNCGFRNNMHLCTVFGDVKLLSVSRSTRRDMNFFLSLPVWHCSDILQVRLNSDPVLKRLLLSRKNALAYHIPGMTILIVVPNRIKRHDGFAF